VAVTGVLRHCDLVTYDYQSNGPPIEVGS